MTTTPKTFCLEKYVIKSFNYLTRMVDKDGLPYFNIFWIDPAEAAHDMSDFGDVMSRQLQAAVMARRMTGVELPIEKIWTEKILSLIDPDTGLLVRPATSFSVSTADPGDQMLTLYALATKCLDTGGAGLEATVLKLCRSLGAMAHAAPVQYGFGIKGLMTCARHLGATEAVAMAEEITRSLFGEGRVFTPENRFYNDGNAIWSMGHTHWNLRSLVGAADYALYSGDPILYSRVDAVYRFVRSTATRFGFLPEVIWRTGDLVACVTCAIMDYLGLAVTLANHGHPEYWGDVERIVRNHLVESQVSDASWLVSGLDQAEDTNQFTWRDVSGRMIGGYTGWSSPHRILAYKEGLFWGGPELHGKIRAFQNCCGGSGTHAFYIAWKNASSFKDGRLTVNLHIDKLLPQAEIRCFQPYQGLLTINLKENCTVSVRVPDFTCGKDVRVESGAGAEKAEAFGNYIDLGWRKAGERIVVRYPLPITEEVFEIGNPSRRKYRYAATWKGDTVIEMKPIGNESRTGYSDFENREVPVFYGEEGPGRLYLREGMRGDGEPELSELHEEHEGMNFWRDLV